MASALFELALVVLTLWYAGLAVRGWRVRR
jgi:hypothetical protein